MAEVRMTKCNECGGKGRYPQMRDPPPRYSPLEPSDPMIECPYCKGKGEVPAKPPLA